MNSKNHRKFKVWDNKLLFQTYQQVIQIKDKIEEQCLEGEKSPESLPRSVIGTDVLYHIVACYDALYIKLLEEELLQAGYSSKQSKSYH